MALIPARAGSKRLPRKNLRMFCGKPLIAWTILAAKRCPRINRIFVSTEDAEIARVARQWGAETPFLRPLKLSTDTASSMDVVLHALTELAKDNKLYDAVALLQPTSPLRTAKHLTEAISLFESKKVPAVVSVAVEPHSPLWTNRLTSKGTLACFARSLSAGVRNVQGPWYRLNGAIYIAKVDFLKKRRDWYSNATRAYVMPALYSWDIDTIDDFFIAELIMKNLNGCTSLINRKFLP